MKNKKGFTLAEVLIALTVIGIIAAITINIIATNSRRTEIETKLRAIMDKMASDIFLDSVDVVQVSNRKIHLTVKIIKNNEERKSVFMSIKKSENEKIFS